MSPLHHPVSIPPGDARRLYDYEQSDLCHEKAITALKLARAWSGSALVQFAESR